MVIMSRDVIIGKIFIFTSGSANGKENNKFI